jgi:hypothetical protein
MLLGQAVQDAIRLCLPQPSLENPHARMYHLSNFQNPFPSLTTSCAGIRRTSSCVLTACFRAIQHPFYSRFCQEPKAPIHIAHLSSTQSLQTSCLACTRLRAIHVVCINQYDFQERAGQVQIMATIYSFASRVIVCSGMEADDSTTLIVEIEGVAANVQRNQETGVDHDRDVPSDRGDTSRVSVCP